ncbi:CAP domain-containing protein [Streptomyces sp. URMC 123]|uniref:CAP domain-containing protein n=1 Tax=Streptomyces sp. URMC 123 TaxID=3423403 RepID=UPI003F1C31AD
MALGAVAVASGMIPGGGQTFALGGASGSAERVQTLGPAGGAPGATPYAAPEDRAPAPADRGADRAPSPGAAPSHTADEPSSRAARRAPAAPGAGKAAPGKPASGQRASAAPGKAPAGARRQAAPAATGVPRARAAAVRAPSAAESAVLSLVNRERARAGCTPLRYDAELARLAEEFSEDMAERDFFAHTDPDGRTPWDRADEAGIDHLGGENIARGQTDPQAVMDAWMSSPGHRANILNCDFTTLGVGAHFGPGGPWWTQNFGF